MQRRQSQNHNDQSCGMHITIATHNYCYSNVTTIDNYNKTELHLSYNKRLTDKISMATNHYTK